jgi:hypothetical protein
MAERWWALTEERSWQLSRVPKMVSKYFGEAGSFAWDDRGVFVVTQGYGWLWKRQPAERDAFSSSLLPWAYLAILNSDVFENLLACYCPRMRGGQLNLSARFVNKVFLPNLADKSSPASRVMTDLSVIGRQIHEGAKLDAARLNELVARAYGFDESDVASQLTPGGHRLGP